jgi:hypothetical protein
MRVHRIARAEKNIETPSQHHKQRLEASGTNNGTQMVVEGTTTTLQCI